MMKAAENTVHTRDVIDPHLLDDREQRLRAHRDRELRTNQDAYRALLFPQNCVLMRDST
ncbi:hypothetical protein [Saccharothrix sp. NRRL B-16348]|uniref:hypothetical protein n=1 Tax=Saccharothrix sp. NRRL B-16348 TaxID=1415542 RepID=UPI000B192A13|nr:hypothetical protein [Saccharothrix sp. NRRL B-16348]